MAKVGKVFDVAYGRRTFARVDCLEPRAAVASGNARQQFFKHFAQIAHERHIDLDVLVDLGRIDLDVNLLGLGCVGRERTGDAIVEAHAAGDQQIGILNGVVDPGFAVHSHHAQVQRMRSREGAEAEQCKRDRNLGALCQRADLVHRARL